MCKYCENDEIVLSGNVEKFNDICLFGLKDSDTLTVGEIVKYFEEEEIQVFYDDRGYLRLTQGEDTGCLDHSIDKVKINYCFNCGNKL